VHLEVSDVDVAEALIAVIVDEDEAVLGLDGELKRDLIYVCFNLRPKTYARRDRVRGHLEEDGDVATVLFALPAGVEADRPVQSGQLFGDEGVASQDDAGDAEIHRLVHVADLNRSVVH
jgi:hypothetical protein